VIHGDGEQSRDFTYVENAVQANLLAAMRAEGRRETTEKLQMCCKPDGKFSLNQMFDCLRENY